MKRRDFVKTLATSFMAPGLLLSQHTLAADKNAEFWRLAAEGNNLIWWRHPRTYPGIGDPEGFRLDNCMTQRRLNAQGRAEARQIGAVFQTSGVKLDRILSSAWCRCTEAADIAFGRHEVWEPINSVFANRDRGPAQTRAVLTAAAQQPAGENWILSTHRSNILLATGQNTSMGDVLLTRYDPKQPDQLRVLARLDWR
ncbi:histidine phosphatase family protein [Thiomicrospira cyclica]|uniref:Phosphoglycerate mutase n=1 Tax=Thiomicrospira cyclica (strain DSM 14477 / JCM 11371 / ALM1) TaxID=717773 RepID=F6DAI7_THICA|nr:histidine phosphatase family protein [Thiomicrospira cyclica]AEG32243.1 Phosphoglycerate mutase [Thiomicrospira cyclica ALM1]